MTHRTRPHWITAAAAALRAAPRILLLSLIALGLAPQTTQAADAAPTSCVLVEKEGKVEFARKGSSDWTQAQVNDRLDVGDRLRTGLHSRAALRWSELSTIRISQLTSLEIQRPAKSTDKPELDLRSGAAYLFSREKPTEIQFRTPVASGAIRGTEFNLAVAEDGKTELALLDGQVDLANNQGSTSLRSGEMGTVEPGRAPSKTALINAVNVIQWVLYYPEVVDPDELKLSSSEQDALKNSLDAYRSGDVLGALHAYPESRTPASDADKTFHAALLLAAGRVDETESELNGLQSPQAAALREVIAAVKHQKLRNLPLTTPSTGSGWMARSYYYQSRAQLPEALHAADAAIARSPRFGAAWIRAAELEFGFGHVDQAIDSLNKGLELSPRNAEGFALKGFLLTAKNDYKGALDYFDRAIALDGALANAWLGRGLVKIRQGKDRHLFDIINATAWPGREDLLVAVTLEPQRSVLRSYLGKAFAAEHDVPHAYRELDLAQRLDPNDPTSFLYLALLDQQENRVNEAVSNLEESKELNDNRSLFRSRFLLDQDKAVRSANLASIYRDEGMFDTSVQEAARAVDNDYGNYSAHLFLSESYDALRDPKLINLRYETPWFSQLLVSQLLAPVGAGNLSQSVSQQEYSKLFASDGLGVFNSTTYSSHGDWLETASQFGVFGNTSYSFDANYRTERGYRPNNDLDQLNLALSLKQQITEKDSVFFQASYFNMDSGDLAQYYYQTNASQTLRVTENQNPNLLLGYHREWAPGSHTLFLGGRFEDTLTQGDTDPSLLFLGTQVSPFTGVTNMFVNNPAFYSLDYHSRLIAYSAELQQIYQNHRLTYVVGARYQNGYADTSDDLLRAPPIGGTTTVDQNNTTDLTRVSVYGYQYWNIVDPLTFIVGITYDHLKFPVNIDTSPISDEQDTKDQISPKVGVVWTPLDNTHLRGIYTKSLGGVFFDNSVRLEPTEIAGFNQAFRSLIPESVVGLVPGTSFDTGGIGLDQSFETGTYLVIQGEWLKSTATRTVGLLTNSDTLVPIPDSPSSTPQSLDYLEKSLTVSLTQLLGKDWAAGGRYRLTSADLNSHFNQIGDNVFGSAPLQQDVNSILNQLDLYVIYQHRSGFFAQFDTIWSAQSNHGYDPAFVGGGDNFWQYNLFAGYRFLQRRVEVRFGLLNIGNQNYRLNPLTLYNELPRERTFTASLKLNF